MHLTVKVEFKYPSNFIVTIDNLPNFKQTYKKLEDIYRYIKEDKNTYIEKNNLNPVLTIDWRLKYFYTFTNPYGDNITVTPDNKLSTKQLLYLYEFDIENNSKIVIECKDNESDEYKLTQQFESFKRQIQTTISPIELYYSNFI